MGTQTLEYRLNPEEVAELKEREMQKELAQAAEAYNSKYNNGKVLDTPNISEYPMALCYRPHHMAPHSLQFSFFFENKLNGYVVVWGTEKAAKLYRLLDGMGQFTEKCGLMMDDLRKEIGAQSYDKFQYDMDELEELFIVEFDELQPSVVINSETYFASEIIKELKPRDYDIHLRCFIENNGYVKVEDTGGTEVWKKG